MSVYAVGDIQGCYRELMEVLDQVAFNPSHDQLWAVGDLINRGPDSKAVLRFLYDNKQAARCVLGNPDLHSLAAYPGERTARPTPTRAHPRPAPPVLAPCPVLGPALGSTPVLGPVRGPGPAPGPHTPGPQGPGLGLQGPGGLAEDFPPETIPTNKKKAGTQDRPAAKDICRPIGPSVKRLQAGPVGPTEPFF